MNDNSKNYDDLESILREFSGGADITGDVPVQKKADRPRHERAAGQDSAPYMENLSVSESEDANVKSNQTVKRLEPELSPPSVIKRPEADRSVSQVGQPAGVSSPSTDSVIPPAPAAQRQNTQKREATVQSGGSRTPTRAAASAPGFFEGYEDRLNPDIYIPVRQLETVYLDKDGNQVTGSSYADRTNSEPDNRGVNSGDYEEIEDEGGEYEAPNLFPGDNEDDEYEEQFIAIERRRKRLKWIIPLSVFVVIISAALYFTFYYANKIAASKTIFPNVYINGIEVGGMTYDEADSYLKDCKWDQTVEGEMEIRLPLGIMGYVDYVKSGVRLSRDEVLELAAEYGRDDNKLVQLKNYVNAMILPTDVVDREVVVDTAYIGERVDEAIAEFDKYIAENAEVFDIENSEYIIIKGADEIKIDRESLVQKVVEGIRAEEEAVVYRVGEDITLTTPDFEAELKEKKAEPSDAYYDPATDKIIEEVVGSEFDPVEAEKLWQAAEPLDFVDIPLKTTPAKVKAKDLEKLLFADVLGEYSTDYAGSTDNRISNIHLAVQQINNMVIMPGETFSYNETLGERTKEKGYLEAAAYDNDEVIQALGGGICQVSSTICCAVRLARLDYTRTCHQYKVGYLDYGLDATVDYAGRVDFTFTNNKEYPVKIVIELNDASTTITVKLLGTDTDHYTAKFKNEFVAYLKHSDGFPEDTDHSEEYNNTTVGYIYDAYVEVYDEDGNYVETLYSNDYDRCWYYLHKEDRQYPAYEQSSAATDGQSSDPTDFIDTSIG